MLPIFFQLFSSLFSILLSNKVKDLSENSSEDIYSRKILLSFSYEEKCIGIPLKSFFSAFSIK